MIYGRLLATTATHWVLEVEWRLGDAEHFNLAGQVEFPRKLCRLIRNVLGGRDAIAAPFEVLDLLGKFCTETAA